MNKPKLERVFLVGNPNTGKSTLYNRLTGLNQKTGNFPGVTVEKKSSKLSFDKEVEIIDLPGLYSLKSKSQDEFVVVKQMLKVNPETDAIIFVADGANIERSLLLFTQLMDLQIPSILLVNASDMLARKKIQLQKDEMAKYFGVDVVLSNAKRGDGIKTLISKIKDRAFKTPHAFLLSEYLTDPTLNKIQEEENLENVFQAWMYVANAKMLKINKDFPAEGYYKDSEKRIGKLKSVLNSVLNTRNLQNQKLNKIADNILTHNIFGYLIFFGILFLIFQAIYSWSDIPMTWIDDGFARFSEFVSATFPDGMLRDLITEGIIPGIGGVVIFIPQIAILFFFLSLMEQSGYMSRVVYLMDRFMRRFGLNGRSVVPLMSGLACAIPAIMAARNINNWKEQLITVLVTPFMTCAARLPVYAILIAIAIPSENALGIFNMQGLVLMGLYLFGLVVALLAALILHFIIRSKAESYLIMELPSYMSPNLNDLITTIYRKSKAFVWEAGKIIFVISILLWFLASFGPGKSFRNADEIVKTAQPNLAEEELEVAISSHKLEHSFAGYMGKAIEPAIKPLGYDWKIGIALITSFAAREVFVGTISTIYSIGAGDDDTKSIIQKLKAETNSNTGKPAFSFPVVISLLIFYALAMQCMSTVAIVKRETNSWPIAIAQFFFMTLLAYVLAALAYNILS